MVKHTPKLRSSKDRPSSAGLSHFEVVISECLREPTVLPELDACMIEEEYSFGLHTGTSGGFNRGPPGSRDWFPWG